MGRDVHNSRRDTGATRNLSLALIDTRAARILITVLLFALALAFLYAARHTFIAFLFAIFFAYLVDPAVSRIERWVHGRGRAIAIIYLLLVGVLITFFVFVGPRLGHQAARLGETLPGLSPNTSLSQIADKIGMEHGWSPRTREQLKAFLARYGNDVTRIAQRAVVRVAEAAQNIWLLFLIPILAVFFLQDGRSFSETALSMVQTRPQREFLQGVLNDLNQMLAHFIRAQLTLALLSLVAYISFLSALRVPYALILGTAGGFYPRSTHTRSSLVVGLHFRSCRLASAFCTDARHCRWNSRIYPCCRTADGRSPDSQRGAAHGLFGLLPLAGSVYFPDRLALDSGLCSQPQGDGQERGTASARGNFWCAGRR